MRRPNLAPIPATLDATAPGGVDTRAAAGATVSASARFDPALWRRAILIGTPATVAALAAQWSLRDGGPTPIGCLLTEPTNLTDMLADLADAASILGGAKDIYITFRANEDLTIDADRAKLYQVFLNLVDNAVKYTPEGGMISLTVHRDKNVAEVRVRDTGIGISGEHQKKIFDRFYRVDKARSREMGGVGLGLSIVQWTVQAHDGEIRVESEPGQGSTFVVRLPLLNPTLQNEDMGITPPRHRTLAQAFDVKRLLKKPRGSSDEKKKKDPAAEELKIGEEPKIIEEPEAKQG